MKNFQDFKDSTWTDFDSRKPSDSDDEKAKISHDMEGAIIGSALKLLEKYHEWNS